MDLNIDGIIDFSDYPAKNNEIFYRLPYRFLNKHEERVRDAWDDIGLLNELLSRFGGRFKADNDTTFVLENRLIIKNEFGKSDLWIKISDEKVRDPSGVQDILDEIDGIMRGLGRMSYRYISRDGLVYAHPSTDSGWGDELPGYIGLDAGSISINSAVVDEFGTVLETDYTYTEGDVINNVKKSLAAIAGKLPANIRILGSGVTGSGHEISRALMNADVYETELDAHAEAALHLVPSVKVIFDIGGQDSKVMYIRDNMLDDAGMNKKCGAGTGSFLNAQAARLGIPIEKFGEVSMAANKPYRFSSMCTVFVGRDLIAEQAKGNTKENIIAGLHRSLAMNFFSTLGINKKKIEPPIVFQGGVASNVGVKRALEDCLEEARGEKSEIIVPMFNNVMGAVGMALYARRETKGKTQFRGFEDISQITSRFEECVRRESVQCGNENICDLVKLYIGGQLVDTLYACSDYNEHRDCREMADKHAAGFNSETTRL